jgi:hypothetical protein
LHTVTVSIQGDVSVSESVQVEDTQALPPFIRLQDILHSGETLQPARRRGRPRKQRLAEEANRESFSDATEAVVEPAEA